ncbi:MAG: hypothetical protein U1E87_09455 [Alphaproteobacteria bacterium]
MKPPTQKKIIRPQSETTKVIAQKLEVIRIKSKTMHQEKGNAGIRELNARRKALKALEQQSIQRERKRNVLFISHSGSGVSYARTARQVADEYGFLVTTGFDDSVQRSDVLPHAIINQILSCDFFLGIWTADFEAESIPGEDVRGNRIEPIQGYIPGVWLPFELGVAASHEKPIRILVLKGTNKYYYEKPFHYSSQILFEPVEFEKKVRDAVSVLAEKRDVAAGYGGGRSQ